MVHVRGKSLALTITCLGLLTLLGAGFVLRGRVIEEWYLWKLSAADGKQREAAVRKLGEMRSLRAVPLLMEGLRRENRSPGAWPYVPAIYSPALARIGAPAVPALVAALKDQDRGFAGAAARVLAMIGPEAKAAVPVLCAVLKKERGEAQNAAVEALLRIDPDSIWRHVPPLPDP